MALPALPDWWLGRPLKRNTVWYEREACEAANLPHPDDVSAAGGHTFLGHFIPADSEAIVDRLTRARLKSVRKQIEHLEATDPASLDAVIDREHVGTVVYDHLILGQDPEDYFRNITVRDQIRERVFYAYEQYLKARQGGGPRPKEWRRIAGDLGSWKARNEIKVPFWASPADRRFAAVLHQGHANEDFTADLKGYLCYLREVAPEMVALLQQPIPVFLPLNALQGHSWITAGSAAGKSELLKLMIHGCATDRTHKSAVVLVEPHGDLAAQVARWHTFTDGDRLVFIDPNLAPGRTPTFNPLQVKKSDNLDVVTQQIVAVFEELLQGSGVTDLTVNMRRIMKPCLRVLLEKGDATLRDLARFMARDARARPYIDLGKQSTDTDTREFFTYEFEDRKFDATKGSLATKIGSIINTDAEKRLFLGPSTFDLEDLVTQGKVIVFRFSKGEVGVDAAQAFGRFVIAALMAIAERRAAQERAERIRVYVCADECHNYISRGGSTQSILSEARKFMVFITLSHQMVEQLPDALRGALKSNVQLKIAGRNGDDKTRRVFANSTNTPMEEVSAVRNREFLVSVFGAPAFKLYAASHLADEANRMTDGEWQELTAGQAQRYYRDIIAPEPEHIAPGKGEEPTTPPIKATTRKPKYSPPRKPKYPINRP